MRSPRWVCDHLHAGIALLTTGPQGATCPNDRQQHKAIGLRHKECIQIKGHRDRRGRRDLQAPEAARLNSGTPTTSLDKRGRSLLHGRRLGSFMMHTTTHETATINMHHKALHQGGQMTYLTLMQHRHKRRGARLTNPLRLGHQDLVCLSKAPPVSRS